MTVTLLDDHGALPTIFVPTTVQTAIMPIIAIFGSRSAKLTVRPIVAAISVHAPVAAYSNAELLSTGNTWKS
jgi:biotin transporter BioY